MLSTTCVSSDYEHAPINDQRAAQSRLLLRSESQAPGPPSHRCEAVVARTTPSGRSGAGADRYDVSESGVAGHWASGPWTRPTRKRPSAPAPIASVVSSALSGDDQICQL